MAKWKAHNYQGFPAWRLGYCYSLEATFSNSFLNQKMRNDSDICYPLSLLFPNTGSENCYINSIQYLLTIFNYMM